MNPERDRPGVEAGLAALAGRQYGVVTRDQLRRLGIGDTGIRARLRTQRLHRLHRGVYAVGHCALPSKAHWMAAVLACGDGAVLSHTAAAAHLQIRESSASRVDVTVPGLGGRRTRAGIRIHRSGRLTQEDVTVHEGIQVTTVARTLLDLADVLNGQALKRAIDEAEYLRVLDMTALIAAVDRNPGRSGAKLLEAAGGALELTESVLEDRFSPWWSGADWRGPESARGWRATGWTSTGRRRSWSSSWTASPRTAPEPGSKAIGGGTGGWGGRACGRSG
jgi:hypothetical protein